MAQTAALTPTSNVELVKRQARPVTPGLRVNDEPVSPQIPQKAEGGSLTPDADIELAFSPDLIPQEVRDALAGDLHVCFICIFSLMYHSLTLTIIVDPPARINRLCPRAP